MYICVHGIRSKGHNNVDKMGEILQQSGNGVIDFDYPVVSLADVLFKLRGTRPKEVLKHARRLRMQAAAHHRPHVIAHSMGCMVTLRAMEAGAQFGTVYFFAPALNSDFVIPNWGCQKLHIIFNPNDKAIKMGSWLHYHPFGDMGLKGSKYHLFDHRIRNVMTKEKGEDWLNHNYAFDDNNISYWTAILYLNSSTLLLY